MSDMEETEHKQDLAQMCYFTTVRPKEDIKEGCVDAVLMFLTPLAKVTPQ